MANPQKENGFTPIANELLEALAKTNLGYSGTCHALILAIIRKTYGFRKKEDKISISQLEKMLNLSRRTIIYNLQELEAKNILIIKRVKISTKNEINIIKFNEDYDTWVVQNSAKQVKNNRIKAKLRSAKLRKEHRVVQNSVNNMRSFAPTKETITKEITPSPSASGDNTLKDKIMVDPQPQNKPESPSPDLVYESDESVTPTNRLKKQEAIKDGYKGHLVKPLRKWAEDLIGKKYPNVLKQEKFIGQMLYAGYTEAQIKETFENLLDDIFWGERGFDFAQVANEISKAKKSVEVPWHLRSAKKL